MLKMNSGKRSHPEDYEGEEGEEFDASPILMNKIARLYTDKRLCDMCLVVDGVEFPCHRLILSTSSEVFQVMLMNPQWNESSLYRVELVEQPDSKEVFGDFLNFFYSGKIQLSLSNVMSILQLADKYDVTDLINLCLGFMSDHTALAAKQGCLVSWVQQYVLYRDYKSLSKTFMNFLTWNFELITMETNSETGLDPTLFIYLLKQSNLVVCDEMTLYRYAKDWLLKQKEFVSSDEEFEYLVKEVMCNIRFPLMSPRQLADLLLCPIASMFKDYFMDRMATAMGFHNGNAEKLMSDKEEGLLQITPRLYTSNTFGSLLTVEKYRSLPSYHRNTLVFNSHVGLADHEGENSREWIVDVYPKGVWIDHGYMILWDGKMKVPGKFYGTVRLSVTCRDPPKPPEEIRVKVGILVYGLQNDIECIRVAREKQHHFSDSNPILHFDDLLPFSELNPTACTPLMSDFLVGGGDLLKMHVIIEPLPRLPVH